MKLTLKSILLFIAITAFSSNAQDLNIIPKPVSAVKTDDKFILRDGSSIFISSNNSELKEIAGIYKSLLHKRTGIDVKIKQEKQSAGIILDLNKNCKIKNDGYELIVENNSVKVTAKNGTGIFYGIQTLEELLVKDKELYYPGCKITDYPRYNHRGFSLDCSRHFQSIAFVKKVLDVMAMLKLNVFHWHLSDDEGWRIESKKYPMLVKKGAYQDSLNSTERNGYYTVNEIHEILAYAKKLRIKVIPEVEMPGHNKAFMESYPELLCPTNPGGNTFCAGNTKSYDVLKNLLIEVAGIFKTDVIHVGGDERPEGIWDKCPKCKQKIADKKLANENMLQNYFMKDICDYVTSKGIKTIAWYANLKDGVPAGQIVEAWHPGEAWESARAGLPTLNADCVYTYFDYPHTAEEKKMKPKWMPILDLEKVYSFNPTPDSLKENEKQYILGGECALWTEILFEKDVQHQIFPRIMGFAEVIWTPNENKNYTDFKNRVMGLKNKISSMGFVYDKGMEDIINEK